MQNCKKKILIFSPNVLGNALAGAAIRSLEFARFLSKTYCVVLFCQEEPLIQEADFEILSFKEVYRRGHFQSADLLITQRLNLQLSFLSIRYSFKIIIDAYVPGPLELMEHFRGESQCFTKDDKKKIDAEINSLKFSFGMADGIMCASERQRAFWVGFILAQNLISLKTYSEDPSLRNFLITVPFGISSSIPQKRSLGPREKFGLKKEDHILLWGGGIWNWFDPLTLIRAMAKIQEIRDDIKLVFMGVIHPDSAIPKTLMAQKAIDLAKELHCLNRCVFFNMDWVSYNERENYLAESTFAVSTHFDTLETTFSFRTRILDCLWAELPVISTEGDYFSDIIEKCDLGILVPYRNVDALSNAILDLAENEEKRKTMKNNIASIREQFFWTSVCLSVQKMCENLLGSERTQSSLSRSKKLCALILKKIKTRFE